MAAPEPRAVGQRIAARRRICRMTQADLARESLVSLSMIRKIEQGSRAPGDDVLDSIAAALAIDPIRLLSSTGHADSRVHDALPAIAAAIADYDLPEPGPIRPLSQLRAAVDEAVSWRLGAQYVRLARTLPDLLPELARAHAAAADPRLTAALLVTAYRCADAVAYKYGATDLSARLIELMRWAAAQAEDPVLGAVVGYVRTEVFFVARAHTAGLRALEAAVDRAPRGDAPGQRAARGALHVRAAVIAGRAADPGAAAVHFAAAREFASGLPEGVYSGTAFGPDTVRAHEVSVAVSLGGDHIQAALLVAREWKPPREMPAERRSGFYIELARAQLWAGQREHAFESLKVARRIAPQHTREHRWAREDAATLVRLSRASSESLLGFAEWVRAV